MRRFYAAPNQFTQNSIKLSLEESKHLRDVLRLREGDEVSVFDGEGKEYGCKIEKTGGGKEPAELTVTGELEPPAPESKLDLTLAIALLKGEKFELVIQKATELGVNKIVPLQTLRSDVKIKKNREAAKTAGAAKKIERWRRVALEAVKQCGRARIPEITAPIEFSEFIKGDRALTLFFSERKGKSLDELENPMPGTDKITAVIGPEGGWDDTEIMLAENAQARIITLGGRILRAETAGIVVIALLQNLYGDLS
ncbi:MAG TPA: 16S rRNA (uracil(1498)-N(3))-methyltransferase [Pyrinomonadaceae bacterium]|jgi:16S rRNA (uracil1498-N3)-methyltransferase|nr:16S rRNA (uracil(1498)-N(3))-methyltransferase [Pyrinomonadaceae bacterium]